MSIYRQKRETKQVKLSKAWIHTLAIMLFCMVLSIGTVVLADEVPATVVASSAKIRATADTSSEALAGVKSGDTLSICGQTTGTDGSTWYQVYVDADTKGFIRSDLVQKKSDGKIATVANENSNKTSSTTNTDSTNAATSTDNATTTTVTEETKVTAVDAKTGTVVTSNVRIRKGASTQHDVVATANKGMVLTVTGEAAGADGKTWYQVSFSYNNKEITGFIRSDLVTFDSVPADTAVSEITGTEEIPEETATEMSAESTTETPAEEQVQEETTETKDDSSNIILMNVDTEVYVLPGFTPVIVKWEGQEINSYKNGQYYLFYAQKQSGETGWFLYDSANGVYQRYVYDTLDATIPDDNNSTGNLFLIIILVIVIVILLGVIGLMFFKLREYTTEYYEDEEYDDEEYDEEYEEEEYEEEPVKLAPKRVEKKQVQNRSDDDLPQQRRQPQQGEGQQIRRQPQQNAGQQPRRQPQQENAYQSNRPTQQQNKPNKGKQQLQNGRRAKNFLDEQDDDMEFIDI